MKRITIILYLLFIQIVYSQQLQCGTITMNEVGSLPAYNAAYDWYIPVVFHIIQNSSNEGNVLDSQIITQMNVLNEKYANTNFSFYLLGIRRIVNDNWRNINVSADNNEQPFYEELQMKNSLAIVPEKAINVYVTTFSISGRKGVSVFPNNPWASSNANVYGICIKADVFPGGNDTNNNQGIILVHEVGHFLGLLHTFSPDCIKPTDDPDFCPDTPYHTVNVGCYTNDKACDGSTPAPIHNFMNYTSDACRTEFTINQRQRMNQETQKYRINIGGTILSVNNDITIIAGSSLQLMGGATLNFATGKKIVNNGSLSCSSITLSSSSTWDGVQFNSGSTGSIQYCTISNATNGVYCNNSSPQIRNTTIQNCNTGVYCDYYASPSFKYCTIQNNTNRGVYCYNHSSPNFLDYVYPGYNVIRNNNYWGVYTNYYSNPTLGNSSYGTNSLYLNGSCDILAEDNCVIYAQNDYWGYPTPVPYRFCATNSTITYSPYLSTDPNSGRLILPGESEDHKLNLPEGISLRLQSDDLNDALTKHRERKFDEAIPLFLSIAKSNVDNLIGRYALVQIEDCFVQSGRKDFLDYSKKELKSFIKDLSEAYVVLLELEIHQHINNGNYSEALALLQTILKKYNLNSSIEKNTLFRLGAFYLQLYGDKNSAEKYFDELKKKYPNDPLVLETEEVRGLSFPQKTLLSEPIKVQEVAVIESGNAAAYQDVMMNYPNPFNPTTNISFLVKEKGIVVLKVYNLLGEEVANLANNVFDVGKYEVTFDASNLPCGIYFSRLTTPTATITKKMMLVK